MINQKSRKINLTNEDRQKLVSAFAWLIQEDKKQNPELYRKAKDWSILK